MTTNTNTESQITDNAYIENFISEMITHLETDKFMFGQNIVSEDNINMYNIMASGDADLINNFSRVMSSSHFVKKIVTTFLSQLKTQSILYCKMAFSYCNHRVNVWAEINEDDEINEDKLYLLEAKINSYFEKYSFGISLIIVENTDNIAIPQKYKELQTKH